MAKQSVLIVCPGRGTYNAAELGYFHKNHADKMQFLSSLDDLRRAKDQISITELDSSSQFKPSVHGTGENASLLIYACAIADFLSIAQEKYDVAAITGNSMGWYLALAASGALSLEHGAMLVNEMGGLMQTHGTGGQIVYPIVDSNWNVDREKQSLVNAMLQYGQDTDGVEIHISIRLGGMIVFAANTNGLKYLAANLPQEEHFPLRLRGHNAFHSHLLNHMPDIAKHNISADIFKAPKIPLIDGQGQIWMPYSTDTDALFDYTLGAQLNTTYDFSAAINTGIKEFAPDKIIVLGPGTTMGAPVAQVLIQNTWQGITNKTTFKQRQSSAPYIISMGMDGQRNLA